MPRPSRWIIVPVLASLLATPQHQAQAQLISFGITAGASVSTFTGDFATDVKNNATFIGGAFVRLQALGFAVQPGLYYAGKSAKFATNSPLESTTKLGYIQIPVVLRLRLGPLYVGGGPSIGIKISCVNDPKSGTASDCDTSEGAKSTEFTGILEAGLDFRHFSIGARADIGISNAFEAINSGNSSVLAYKTQTISAMIGYRF